MKHSYYAVTVGRKVGVYADNQTALEQVHRFPNGRLKSFPTVKEANQRFVSELGYLPSRHSKETPKTPNQHLIAYTDGSYNSKNKSYGSGVVLIHRNKIIAELSIMGNNPVFEKSAQAAGELLAVIYALQWAVIHDHKQIEICHDYSTASQLIQTDSRPNAPIAKKYKSLFFKLVEIIGEENICFTKVKAHSTDQHNRHADKLAHRACRKK